MAVSYTILPTVTVSGLKWWFQEEVQTVRLNGVFWIDAWSCYRLMVLKEWEKILSLVLTMIVQLPIKRAHQKCHLCMVLKAADSRIVLNGSIVLRYHRDEGPFKVTWQTIIKALLIDVKWH